MQSKILPVILGTLLLFCISNRGGATKCNLKNIVVTQTETSEWAHGMSVYAVTVKNTCDCPQSNVMLACDGFNTTLEMDPLEFQYRVDGGLCPLNNGEPVVQGHDVNFKYAWDPPFPLQPAKSTIASK
uniref:Uncharacterized protein n=1 Tax=Avena sativa TaxID=4498 RepID=A0ACD5Y9D1_AVESA